MHIDGQALSAAQDGVLWRMTGVIICHQENMDPLDQAWGQQYILIFLLELKLVNIHTRSTGWTYRDLKILICHVMNDAMLWQIRKPLSVVQGTVQAGSYSIAIATYCMCRPTHRPAHPTKSQTYGLKIRACTFSVHIVTQICLVLSYERDIHPMAGPLLSLLSILY